MREDELSAEELEDVGIAAKSVRKGKGEPSNNLGQAPKRTASQADHAAWLTKVANRQHDPFVEAERHGRGLDAVLVLRTQSGKEATFHRLRDAFKPDTLVATLAELDGTEPPSFTQKEARRIASAMIRLAALTSEIGDLQTFIDYGRQYLSACLEANEHLVAHAMASPRDEYAAALAYLARIKRLNGSRDEPPPPVLYATDLGVLHVPRALFWEWVRPRHSKLAPTTLIGHMTLAGWVAYDLDQRPVGREDRDSARARLRLWRVEQGWEGIRVGADLQVVEGAQR